MNGTHERVVKTLLILDVLRGEDSTGVAVVRKHSDDVHVAKELGNPFNLFETKRFDKAMGGNNKVIIGHNRYATQGGVTRRNAHPFEFDTLVGAHNGTLASKWKLMNAKDYVVDSENLYHHIEERGIDDAIAQLGGHGNAWALTWWDKIESSLNILRNKERPLYHVFTQDNSVMFWASEMWMLYAALNRTDLKFGDILPVPEDTLYTIAINKQGKLEKPRVRAVIAPKPVVEVKTSSVSTSSSSTTSPSSTVKQGQLTVVGETKKSDPQAGKGYYDPSYLGQKERTFELISINVDREHGGEYVLLFDPEHPYKEVRLYLKPKEGDDLRAHARKGGTITSKVSQFCQRDGRSYYKASPWDVKLIPISEPKLSTVYPTHKGVWVSEKEWQQQYPSCNWCTSPLFPADAGNRFTTGGECLCPDCAKDPEINQYVKFV